MIGTIFEFFKFVVLTIFMFLYIGGCLWLILSEIYKTFYGLGYLICEDVYVSDDDYYVFRKKNNDNKN